MDNFDEGYDEFSEIEDNMENFQEEMDGEYIDSFDEGEMNDFEALSTIKELEENQNEISEEHLLFSEKDEPLERKDPDQKPVSHDYAEAALPNEIEEHPAEEMHMVEIESIFEGMEQTLIEWEDENEIRENDLPSSPFLQPINRRDELYNEIGIRTDEEKEAYWEFVSQCMNMEHKVIMDIPLQKNAEFWPPVETDESLSFAFSSMDFHREHPFDRYQWKRKKVFEEVKNLGITYSSLSNEDGRENTHRRYADLVGREFRNQANFLLETYEKHPHWLDKDKTFNRIAALDSEIRKCNEIWDKYSSWK